MHGMKAAGEFGGWNITLEEARKPTSLHTSGVHRN